MTTISKLKQDNLNNDEFIREYRDRITALRNVIRAIQTRINDNNANKSINQKLEMDVKKENERLLKQQEDNMIALNSGKLSITRQSGESKQEYLDRMNQIGTAPDESLELQAAYKNTEDLKLL